MFHATPAQTERNFTCLFRGEQRNPGEKKKQNKKVFIITKFTSRISALQNPCYLRKSIVSSYLLFEKNVEKHGIEYVY